MHKTIHKISKMSKNQQNIGDQIAANSLESAQRLEAIKNLIFGENIQQIDQDFQSLKNLIDKRKEELDTLMNRMKDDAPKHHVDLSIEDTVMIVDGPFKELEGKVGEIDESRGKVKVLVSMFGRETPVELDFLQVKKV